MSPRAATGPDRVVVLSLRKHCAATLGVSPHAYRRTFRGATESRSA